jgi:hypothetical protein
MSNTIQKGRRDFLVRAGKAAATAPAAALLLSVSDKPAAAQSYTDNTTSGFAAQMNPVIQSVDFVE